MGAGDDARRARRARLEQLRLIVTRGRAPRQPPEVAADLLTIHSPAGRCPAEDLAVMEKHNPAARAQIEEERKVEEFLKSGEVPPAPPADPHAGHKQP